MQAVRLRHISHSTAMNIVRIVRLSTATNHIVIAVNATRIVLVAMLVKVGIVAAICLVIGTEYRGDGVGVLVEIVLIVIIVVIKAILSKGLDIERLEVAGAIVLFKLACREKTLDVLMPAIIISRVIVRARDLVGLLMNIMVIDRLCLGQIDSVRSFQGYVSDVLWYSMRVVNCSHRLLRQTCRQRVIYFIMLDLFHRLKVL